MCEVKSILEKHKIQECSFENKFEIHHNNRIDALSFVMGFFNMLLQGKNTIECWAGEIFKLNGNNISIQGLAAKLQFRHVDFVEEFLKKIIANTVLDKIGEKEEDILNKFNNVYLEDSTIISLPDEMFEYFKGTVNQFGATSQARIQLRLELKTGTYANCDLLSYRNNDQSYSAEILNDLKSGDLVIRDLGYYSLNVFQKIIDSNAFFISRYLYKTLIYNALGEDIEFYNKLRSARRKGTNFLDLNVLVGKEAKVPMRLIAIRAPKEVELARRTKMRKDKLKNCSQDYLEMLHWTIYLTNIDQKDLTVNQINKLYGFRWRIEIMFKCWKSKFNLYRLFYKKRQKNPGRVYITFYLTLIWLTLFVRKYNYYLIEVYRKENKILSLFKFADFMKTDLAKFDDENTIEYLARYCCQQKRKIKSSTELIYLLNFT